MSLFNRVRKHRQPTAVTADHDQPVIELRGLSKMYGIADATTVALDAIDITIEHGEFVAIMGPSGCGKTTLLNILGLLETPTYGSYMLDGRRASAINGFDRARLRRDRIGMIFQSFNLLNRMNVLENVALPLTYRGFSETKRLTAASDILRTFELQEREYYMPAQLSGGQLQRVAIARALVNNPKLILADEPTGSLDSKSSDLIMRELSDIHKHGNTIIVVTHNPDLTVWADRIIHMIDGRIARDSKHPAVAPDPKAKRPLNDTKTPATKPTPKKRTARSTKSKKGKK